MKKVATVVLAVIALVVFAAGASAQQPLEYKVTVKAEPVAGSPGDHFLTFTGPVHIPEVTLPAGTYIFSLQSSSIVQVMSADRSEVYAMFFTAPVQRAEIADEVEMTFVPMGDYAPQRIAKWFLPYKTAGYEFLYPASELRGAR